MAVSRVCRILRLVASLSGNAKLAYLIALRKDKAKAWKSLRKVFIAAMDPYRHYGVRVPDRGIGDYPDVDIQADDLQDMHDLLRKLATRELAGKAAHDAVNQFRGDYHALSTLLVRILNKNLKIGVQDKSANKVEPGLIPIFGAALAPNKVLTNGEAEAMAYPRLAELKYDGNRVFFVPSEAGMVPVSREGHPFHNLPTITTEVNKLVRILKWSPFVLDGEVVGIDFDDAGRMRRSKNKTGDADMVYHVFDVLSLEHWQARKSDVPQRKRRKILKALLENLGENSNVVLSKGKVVHSVEELWAFYRKALRKGPPVEGLIVKDLDAPYSFKRSKAWQKLKPSETFDVECVGVYEGKGMFDGSLGGIRIRYKGVVSKCGGGFARKLRDTFWKRPDLIVGKVVEIRADSVTKEKKFRFPRFVRIRLDKTPRG